MTFGSPKTIDYEGVKTLYTNIRHGAEPAGDEIEKLLERYKKIGRCPLEEISNDTAIKLQKALDIIQDGEFKVYFSTKYSSPNIHDAIKEMEDDGIEECIAIALEPQYSTYSIGTYEERIYSDKVKFYVVKSWHDEEELLNYWVDNINKLNLDLKNDYKVLFTSHSLPEVFQEYDDTYLKQVAETIEYIAKSFSLDESDYAEVWQSASENGMEWLGPDICDYVRDDKDARKGYLVVPIGFISDHIETLYDLDIECNEACNNRSKEYVRVPMPNDEDSIIRTLVNVVEKNKNNKFDFIKKVEASNEEELVMPDFVKKLIEKKGRENVKMPTFVRKMLEKKRI